MKCIQKHCKKQKKPWNAFKNLVKNKKNQKNHDFGNLVNFFLFVEVSFENHGFFGFFCFLQCFWTHFMVFFVFYKVFECISCLFIVIYNVFECISGLFAVIHNVLNQNCYKTNVFNIVLFSIDNEDKCQILMQ